MDKKIAQKVAEVLKAVAHPIRLQIIEALEKKELTVTVLTETLLVQQAVVSRHLAIMRDKGILDCQRDGLNVYYHIANPNVINLLHCVYPHCDSQNST
ncbi:MAG: metalloregulator ArsR/SmtB family transcription factor [Planctomycetaceae bacterium]|nr:metalloregulator ArsR/SmtB family transcription factor [Planctomycetaceae bacterium]